MKHYLLALLALAASSTFAQSKWVKQTAPVMTPWGEALTAEDVWQEYPRPSMTRKNWMNLNGVWQYAKRSTVNDNYEKSVSTFSKSILVPFPVESALSGIMDKNFSANKNATHLYRRTFTLTDAFRDKNTLLHFGAVDWRCYVYVNGQLAGSHDGGSDPFTFDITGLLKESGEQELQVAVWDPTSSGGQPNGKQSNNPSGIWYTPNSGIWQTVWLEPVNKAHVLGYEPIPDIDNSSVSIRVKASEPCEATLTVKFDGKTVATKSGSTDNPFSISIPDARLWSPESPNLYTLNIALKQNGRQVDSVNGYFGMRKFSRGMVDGRPCVLLNNSPYYLYGPLDQGWWPDGLLTPPSYEAMIYDLQTIKDFGMNMVRKHIKVENDLWYDWCDRNGLVVWQDMPSGCESGLVGTYEQSQQNFYRENDAIIDATRHHACIGAWVVWNESWGQHPDRGMAHTRMGVNRVMAANHDPGRFVHAVTGWVDVEMGDFIDKHSYPAPSAASNPINERVASCGEFGGINLFVDGHMWAGSDVNYTTVDDGETYTNLYDHYTDCLQQLQKDKGLWMSVYTQITDVEQECNGLMTYDRKVLKVTPEQQAGMRAKILRTIHNRYTGSTTVVPAGDEKNNITWNYTTSDPGEGWYEEDFEPTSWRSGLSGFGGSGRTSWNSSDIWLRRSFSITDFDESKLADLRLWLFHDEDAEIYINGQLAAKMTGYNNNYELWPLLPGAITALRLDGSENVMAIHCRQTVGGQFIDCGLKVANYTPNEQLTVSPMPAPTPVPSFGKKDGKVYLMTYTTDLSSKLHYAYSADGQEWIPMNGNRPIAEGDMADLDISKPFVRRAEQDGATVFHLIADPTDASALGFYHWQSTDLINWVPTTDTPLVKPSSTQLSAAESPEWIYDEPSATYYIYWNTLVNNKNTFYYSTTKDWKRFSTPHIHFDPGFSAHDIHIEKMGDSYFAFYNHSDNHLYVGESASLKTSSCKFSVNQQRMFSSEITKVQGAQSFPALDGSGWHLLSASVDRNVPFINSTSNPKEKKWYPRDENDFSLPEGMRLGSVMVITTDELTTLLAKYGFEEYDLLPTAETEQQTWKYQTLSTAGTSTTWQKNTYRDTTWKQGKAGFGAGNPPGSNIGTSWNTAVIHLRRNLDLTGFTQEQLQSITGRIHHDEEVSVYFNGVLAFKESGYLTSYKNIAFQPEAIAALTADDQNVIAIECRNTGGGQYIDLGLTAIRPVKTDAITSLQQAPSTATRQGIFNLQGMQLASPQKGINIIDGRKVAVK